MFYFYAGVGSFTIVDSASIKAEDIGSKLVFLFKYVQCAEYSDYDVLP